MSAETIPADVIELVAKTIHDHWQGAPGLSARPWDGEKGTCTKLPAQAEDFRRKARAVMEALATRPAEPSAPVAEAGDGKVVAWRWRVYGCWTGMSRVEPPTLGPDASDLEALVRLSTFQAERARADAAEARIVELEAVEKTLRWSVSDSEASLAAAEQRAADALARAEKAEGALETPRITPDRKLLEWDIHENRLSQPEGPVARGKAFYTFGGWEGAYRGQLMLSEEEAEYFRDRLLWLGGRPRLSRGPARYRWRRG